MFTTCGRSLGRPLGDTALCHVRVFRNNARGTLARGTQTPIGPKRLPFAHFRPTTGGLCEQGRRLGADRFGLLCLAVNCEQGHIIFDPYSGRHGMDDKIAERAERNPWQVPDEPGQLCLTLVETTAAMLDQTVRVQ
jgi:hypothetical protein